MWVFAIFDEMTDPVVGHVFASLPAGDLTTKRRWA
jgi:hypothetical protein